VTEWKVRVGFLPRELADEAKHIVIDNIADESVQYQVMRLVEQAFANGYEAGFQRSHTEESWRQFRAAEAVKKQKKQATEEQPT
jgi:ribulose bisphosphate carboxylase small subunit